MTATMILSYVVHEFPGPDQEELLHQVDALGHVEEEDLRRKPRSASATPYSNHTPMTTAKMPRTKRLSSQESMAPGKSRESSQDRKNNMKVYRDDRLTLDDLEPATKDASSRVTKRPKSAAEMAAQSLSVSLHGVTGELVKPRLESRPGSSRSRIPVPVGRRVNTRSPSPFFK